MPPGWEFGAAMAGAMVLVVLVAVVSCLAGGGR